MITEVFVSQHLIDVGERGKAERCALALAIKQLVKPECKVHVHPYHIEVSIPGFTGYIYVDDKVSKFIYYFDKYGKDHEKIGPTLFQLDIPQEVLK